MKTYLIAAAATLAMGMPAAAIANHPTGDGPGGMVNQMNPDGFKNRGQCEAALARETNRQRQNPDQRVAGREGESGSEFQRNIQARFVCAMDENAGVFRVYLSDTAS